MKLNIKQGDTVQVTAGSDKGKKGSVLELDSKKLKIKVQGARIRTHFTQEGLQKKEGFMSYSNVKLIDSAKPKITKKKTASN